MDFLLFIPLIAAFLICVFMIPLWIKKTFDIGLSWEDMNKIGEKKVSGSGGIIVVLAFLVSIFIFIAYRTFYLQSSEYLIEILALLNVVILLAGIGLIDDLFGWRQGGLSIKSRILLVILASVPLIVINAGKSAISLPIIGHVDLGLLYPLLLIPLGIIGAVTTFNILAGFNGLEAGQGILLLSSVAIVAFLTGSGWLAIIALCMVAATFGFLFYNFYPAKVFPGDSLTYAIGGLIAVLSILGSFEKIAVFFFIPYFIEVYFKSKGRLKKYSFGKPNKDKSLDLRYDELYSLNHVAIVLLKKAGVKSTEKRAVYCIWGFQILIIILGFILFRKGLFS